MGESPHLRVNVQSLSCLRPLIVMAPPLFHTAVTKAKPEAQLKHSRKKDKTWKKHRFHFSFAVETNDERLKTANSNFIANAA